MLSILAALALVSCIDVPLPLPKDAVDATNITTPEGVGLETTCTPTGPEICFDARDNNCNGEIDEGHDADGDGFTWCGGGDVALADCVDSDPDIHPGASEADGTVGNACDGKDNDCDSKVDEEQSCTKDQKKCPEIACPEGRTCDDETGVCIVPRPVGSGCTSDSD